MSRTMKDLALRWSETRSLWKDATAEKFGEKYIARWERDYRSSMGAMESMSAYLNQVRRECE